MLLWGSRVIVPECLRSQVIQELHDGHQGMSKMKSLARGVVWWPRLDRDLEMKVKVCQVCQQAMSMPPANPPSQWPKTNEPWSRIHIDYAGPVENRFLLIVIDSHTKWLEVCEVKSASSASTVQELRHIFARLGLPHTIVSDNGTPFTGGEFQEFVKANGIVHLTTAPYHPASNGLAERAVRIVKTGLKKILGGSFPQRLARILMNYRRTPLNGQEDSPAKLLFGRLIRSRLDLLRPIEVEEHRENLPRNFRKFKEGDKVFVRNFGQGSKWLPGVVSELKGNTMYKATVADKEYHRHADQLRSRFEGVLPSNDNKQDYFWWNPKGGIEEVIRHPQEELVIKRGNPAIVPPVVRKSSRIRKKPLRFEL